LPLVVISSLTVIVIGVPAASAKVLGPNGKIAFAREIPDLEDTATFTIDVDGTDAARLLPGTSAGPHWSPDGSEIAVSSCQNPPDCTTALAIVDADTGGVARWFASPDPDLELGCTVWAPDGTHLACEGFGSSDPTLNGVYAIDATDGQDLTRITSNAGGDDEPGDYSPDGSRVVFLRTDPHRPERRGQALFVADADGSDTPHRITPWGLSEETGSWSPDGDTILFAGAGILYTASVDEGTIERIGLGRSGFAFDPVWSPDGKKIAFALYRRAASQSDIWIARADGHGMRRITHTRRWEHFPDWGPQPTL